MTRWRIALVAALLALCGCVGGVRETTTPRTATEMLLVSTATERALTTYDPAHLVGKQVFLDHRMFESVDKRFVLGALRDYLAQRGVVVIGMSFLDDDDDDDDDDRDGDDRDSENPEELFAAADLILEIRNASLGIWDGDFVIGIPEIPVSAQGLPPALLPPLYLFRKLTAQGWAKFQFRTYDRATLVQVHQSGDLWGSSYYNQWWVLGIGPFDGSNDVYPDFELGTYVPGTATEVVEDEGEDR